MYIIHRSQICKVLCATTGQEHHEETGGGQQSHLKLLCYPPSLLSSESVSFILKQACAHTDAHRSDSALKLMEMGYILPPPTTAVEHIQYRVLPRILKKAEVTERCQQKTGLK